MSTKTKAVAFTKAGPIDEPDSLVEVDFEVDDPRPHDLLVEVRAVSVNPVDVKVRANSDPGGEPRVLGFDAAGVVVAVGSEVEAYEVGDEVFYAGTIDRPGSNAELQLVDERIVGRKPGSLSFAEAAAMPLTSLTAWETLFSRFRLERESIGTLLVLGAGGGVGSMVLQLGNKLTDLKLIAAGSRPESFEWAKDIGAHGTVNRRDLVGELKAAAPEGVNFVFTPFSEGNIEAFAEILRPRGEVVAIDEPPGLDLGPLKNKSITWHWELMFTRPLYEPESTYQRDALNEISRLLDDGTLRTTLTKTLSPLNAETLKEAHRQVESSATIGKVVVEAA